MKGWINSLCTCLITGLFSGVMLTLGHEVRAMDWIVSVFIEVSDKDKGG